MAAPPRTSLSERRADDLRLEIAHAAMRLFVEDGDTSATIDRIAEAAGVAPRTFYRHFEVKEDVVLPLFRRSTQRIADALRAAPVDVEPLDVLVHAFSQQLDEQPLTGPRRTFVGLMMTDPQYRMRWIQVDGDLREAVAELLSTRADLRTDQAAVHLAAELIAHAGRRAFEEWLTVRSEEEIEVLLRRGFALVIGGLRSVAEER